MYIQHPRSAAERAPRNADDLDSLELLGMQTTVGLLEVECLWGRKQSLLPEVIQAR